MKTLENVLEEITPTPDPDFVADMERRMQLGFPPKKPRPLWMPTFHLAALRPGPAMAVAASSLIALALTVALLEGDSGQRAQPDRPVALETKQDVPAASPGGGGRTLERGLAGDAVAERSLPGTALPIQPVPPDVDVAPGTRDRRVERSAQLSLAADPKEFDQIADSVFAIADRRNGFVVQSSFTQGEDGASGGVFELRVPAAQLQSTLNELSRVATVRARSESGTDVTGSFVAARDRLRIARAERKSLLLRLERAETDRAAQAIRQRLEIVAGEITGLRSQLRGMRERTDYAAVSVELVDEDAGIVTSKTETDKAVDDAVGSLEDILNFLIRALGILVPVTLAGAVGWFAATRTRRRARERALA